MKEASKRVHEPWKAFQARQRNQDIKRDAVLQTAAHMFLEQGYRRTSMSELAKRLQITKPALYYYFHNKEQILVECYSTASPSSKPFSTRRSSAAEPA